jgi:RNA-binding protein 39
VTLLLNVFRFGYVEFYDKETVQKALALSGTPFMGQAVMVQPTQSEKNKVINATGNVGPMRLYVGSLHYNLTDDDVRQVFEPFGELDFVNIHRDQSGRSRGYGFVQFKRAEDAKRAMAELNGLELAGRQLKVNVVTESNKDNNALASASIGGAAGIGELDDEGGGLGLNAHSRALLMQKLLKDDSIKPPPLVMPGGVAVPSTPLSPVSLVPNPLGTPPLVTPPLITPPLIAPTALPLTALPAKTLQTNCILLKNMFDPATETDPNFDQEIKDDVEEECSKFGPVLHIYVDKTSKGFVFVKFPQSEHAKKAIEALNGRWFAGRQVTAEYIPEAVYNQRFGLHS